MRVGRRAARGRQVPDLVGDGDRLRHSVSNQALARIQLPPRASATASDTYSPAGHALQQDQGRVPVPSGRH